MDTSAAFWTAFTNFASGDVITVLWADHSGVAGASAFTLNSATSTITNVIASINAMGTLNVTASWVSANGGGTGFSIMDDTSGVSQLSVTFANGADTYSFSTSTEGVAGQVKIHFGTGNDSDEDYYYVNKQDMTGAGLGINDMAISTQASAQATLDAINTAITTKDTARAHFGAMMNRLANTVSNLTIQAENIQAAESQISDVDVAQEMTLFVNNQIKAQAAVAMLAQANTVPQLALVLLGGQ